MKAITICQPWAHLIIHGPKRVENRTWTTDHRGLLAIHAGKSRRFLAAAYADPFIRGFLPRDRRELVFGAVIGTVNQTNCVERSHWDLDDPWAQGPYCHVYEEPKALPEPIRCSGQLHLWNWTAPVAALAAGGRP